VNTTGTMNWYTGPSLLELLESLPSAVDTRNVPFRLPVQRVLRPDRTFRGFSGQIASGTIRKGDAITALPSGRSAKVERIVTWDGDLNEAIAPLSVTLVLDREVDISRGDLIVAEQAPATVTKSVKAGMVWMDQRPLELHRRYLLKHTSQTVPVILTSIEYRADLGTLNHEPARTLNMNDIGAVAVNLLRPIAVDLYGQNRGTGGFILVDPETNGTVAAGMIRLAERVPENSDEIHADVWGPMTVGEREARWGHRGGVLELRGSKEVADAIERSLFSGGAATIRIDGDDNAFVMHPMLLEIATSLAVESGLIALVVRAGEPGSLTARVEDTEITIADEQATDEGDVGDGGGSSAWSRLNKAVVAVHRLLNDARVFISTERAGL
jgi:sulfate adenylyltransferase subunit 1